MNYTPEQSEAIASRGKIIVSASAGSGKTFVMIQKLVALIEGGGDLENVLAVTFTNKAAAQMKEKLRRALISRLPSAEGEARANIKAQLGKIPSADISTIHSFCARLIRTHFYALGVERSFEITVDDAVLSEMKGRAMDNLFDRLYEEGDADLVYVLDRLRRGRREESVKKLLFRAHDAVRNVAGYAEKLTKYPDIYCERGFEEVCKEYAAFIDGKIEALASAFDAAYKKLGVPQSFEKLNALASDISEALASAHGRPLFEPLPALPSARRPSGGTEEEKALSVAFGELRTRLKKKYDALKKNMGGREEEYSAFLASGGLASAFTRLLLQFDGEYAAVKRDENRLDCPDLEHLALKLLSDGDIRRRVNERYKYVFVDEYQDVNPVQESILTLAAGGDAFTVGDVKQAIYGFRGSKSVFFSEKYNSMLAQKGAKKLSVNFRSSDGVLAFVNRLFGDIMTPSSCGIDYAADGVMLGGGRYPKGYGEAQLVVFGRDEKTSPPAEGVYSVKERAAARSGHTREGLAVLAIVRRTLAGRHYDIERGDFVDTQPGDICILTRKNAGESTLGIVRALTDAGYGVEGAADGDLLKRTEIKQLLDILSLIDNCQQDIPLSTAMLSPVGGFTRDELARIRASQGQARGVAFRDCMVNYRKYFSDGLAHKIASFFKKINYYRRLSDILGASALIDRLLSDTGLGARYASGGGAKLAGVRRLQAMAYTSAGELRLSAFLAAVKAAGSVKAPSLPSADSIKVMTMHSSKGLEFPVVIVADIARKFGGNDFEEMPFDDAYGFSPRAFNVEDRLVRTTVLRELCSGRAAREGIKNELNLFYVACTRAMCDLYVLCGKPPAPELSASYDADCYAAMMNVADYCPVYMDEPSDFEGSRPTDAVAGGGVGADVGALFGARYAYADSVPLAVKTSASRLLSESEGEEARVYLFDDDDDLPSGREAGTAYHRFLQLCDLSVRDEQGIAAQLARFTAEGLMTDEQAALLSAERLSAILSMPAFASLSGAQVWREREFLCSLPANELYDTPAADRVLVQGAIDLLAVGSDGIVILDYKFVRMSGEELAAKYAPQLALYKKAVALIMGVDAAKISASIIDLRGLKQIAV